MHGKADSRTAFLADGAMGALIRAYDWTTTDLGPPEGWLPSLKTAVAMVLGSKFPSCIVWGSNLTTIYNDAFRPILGTKPEALGRPFDEVWSEVWEDIAPIAERALAGEATFIEDFALTVERNGHPEDAYFTFCYSPIRDETGAIVGFLDTVIETTKEVQARAALRESEARHRQIVDSATDYAIIASDLDGKIIEWSEGAKRILGWSEEDILGQLLDLHYTPEDVAAGVPGKEREGALSHGCAVDERWHQRKNGERFWASGELTPLRDDAGTITGFVKVMRDRTEHRKTEDALRQYGVLVESMTEGVSLSDESGVIVYTNPAEDRMFGYDRGELIGQHVSVQNAYEPEENMRRVEAVIAQLKASGTWEGEWRNKCKDGAEITTASRITAVEINGRPHWLCVQRDVTEAKRAEEHQKLLINELNHRVKNTLATVQSLANQTFRGEHQDATTRVTFEGRLFALAIVHDVLTRENWEGAELREIVSEALAPYAEGNAGRFRIDGPELRLSPRMALAIAMALHELATNALKYGALSVPSGRVRIEWTISSAKSFSLRWTEEGGPKVTPPTQRGFGTRLIERSLAMELGGDVHLTYEPKGVVCLVEAPLAEPKSPAENRNEHP